MIQLRKFMILFAAMFCCGSNLPPPTRLALVIGNGTYSYADPLPNSLKDARAVADRLRRLGFEVQTDTIDLDSAHLSKRIDDFGAKLRAAGPNVIGFVYYAGHAAQDAFGINYLLPTDAKAGTPDDLRREGVPMPPLLQAMEDANNSVNIVVLDACRDWYKNDRRPKDPRGLHDMGLHSSILIAFATRADATADEGAGLPSSPFSHRLIEALDTQSTDSVALLFDDVQSRVYADTDSLQMPMYVNGLVRAGRWAFGSRSLEEVRDTPRPAIVAGPILPFLKSLDRNRLLQFARGKASFVDALLKRRDILQKNQINTPNRLAFFLASVAFETGGFQQQVEKFGYSANALQSIFRERVTSPLIAKHLAGKPEAVANFVYANRFGNGPPESGDGWRYRGRSFFFITGKANYSRYGKEVRANLVNFPDLANDVETSFAIAGAVWFNARANDGADKNDIALAARRFRGGSFSRDLPARMIWLAQAKRAVGIGD
jgi:predicted chitinase